MENIETNIQEHLAALGHKQAHVTFAMIGALVLVVALMIGGGLMALKSYNASLVRADQANVALMTELHDDKAQMVALNQQILTLTSQQQQKYAAIGKRDASADGNIKEVTNPERSVMQVAEDSKTYLGVLPKITADNLLAYASPDVQGFVALKIDRDRLDGNLTDVKDILSKEQQKDADLTAQKALLQADLDASLKNLDDYKKLAHKGKFRKFLDGAEKVGLVLVGYELGRKF